jgi:hypothetical protein
MTPNELEMQATIDALVAALESIRPILSQAMDVCDLEGIGPGISADEALAQIDAAIAMGRAGKKSTADPA